MIRRLVIALAVLGLVFAPSSQVRAQSGTINSTETRVNNGAPSDVFFNFPGTNPGDVVMIQFGCMGSSVNANHVYVYELQPNGFMVTYFFGQTILCDEQYGTDAHGLKTLTASLVGTITVTTPDHTVTIGPANWTATHKMMRTGYFWQATGGSAQITVE